MCLSSRRLLSHLSLRCFCPPVSLRCLLFLCILRILFRVRSALVLSKIRAHLITRVCFPPVSSCCSRLCLHSLRSATSRVGLCAFPFAICLTTNTTFSFTPRLVFPAPSHTQHAHIIIRHTISSHHIHQPYLTPTSDVRYSHMYHSKS